MNLGAEGPLFISELCMYFTSHTLKEGMKSCVDMIQAFSLFAMVETILAELQGDLNE